MGAALCVAAVLAATRGHVMAAAVLLGLALGTKQWALIAVPPVLVAATAQRVRILVIAAAIAAVLTLPLALGNYSSFKNTARQVQGSGDTEVRPYTIWRLIATPDEETDFEGLQRAELGYEIPHWIVGPSHALIVLLPLPLSFAFWRNRRRFAREDVLLLLALLFLLRCVLDPVNGPYYHVPFIFSLVAWEGLRRRGLPVLSALASGALVLNLHHVVAGTMISFQAFYLGWTLPLIAWLSFQLFAPVTFSKVGKWLASHVSFPLVRAPLGERP